VITAQVPYAVVEEVALNPDRYPAFEIREAHRRTYPAACADLAPQLVGFVGAPEPERLEKTEADQRRLETLELKEDKTADEIDEMVALEAAVRSRDYRAFEEEGRGGLERAFENLLRGQRGYRKVERDVSGQGVKAIEEEPAAPGHDVRLTIDADLQLACEELLEHATDELPGAHIESGALVIINPSGEVLAAASSPRVERARYRDELAREADALSRDRRGGPAYHRAYAPRFPPPPGSVFKPFVAVAGLEAGLIDEQTTVFCDGGIGQKGARIACLGRHENVSLATAMAKSCNAYFGHAGEVLGDVRLRAIASLFGFGERTGFAINGLDGPGLGIDLRRPGLFEADGALDPPNESLRGLRSFGCGQAPFDNVTPLQVARAMAGLATGELPELRIVLAVDDTLVPVPPPAPLPIRSDVLEIVRQTLAGVVSPEGTAKPQGERDLRRFGLVGKSGTAQIATKGLADDAWFAGYLPREKPSLIVVLLLEHATFGERSVHGGEAAVPLLYRLFSDPRAARFLGTRS
jgi:penicillin-binding protein 2